MEFLTNIANGQKNIEKIKSQLFDVVKVPLVTNLHGFDAPNSFGSYRSTGGASLGTVGADFTPTQPKLIFEEFVKSLGQTDADFNKIQYQELKGGKKIILSAELGNVGFQNLRGKQDELNARVCLSTGFDGLTTSKVFIQYFRLVCSNGMKAWKTEFELGFKNTKGNIGKINSMVNDIAKATDKMEQFTEYIQLLDKKAVRTEDVEKFLLKAIGYNNAMYSELGKVKSERLTAVNESIELEFSRTGATYWGLINGITHYTNHIAQTDNRDDYLLTGAGLKLNDTAQKLAFEMAF